MKIKESAYTKLCRKKGHIEMCFCWKTKQFMRRFWKLYDFNTGEHHYDVIELNDPTKWKEALEYAQRSVDKQLAEHGIRGEFGFGVGLTIINKGV